MARGGPRTPRNPAPVSTPQSGARTDGGAGSSKQPLRDMPMDAHGEREAMLSLQGAAPMAARPGPQPTGAPPGPQALPDPFGPTQRPNEPITAGLRQPQQSQFLPPDPDELVRLLYSIYPHPDIGRLIR